jgi:hypothetical protein
MIHPDPAKTKDFIERWAQIELNEKAVAQTHFAQLCHLLGVPAPADDAATQHTYRFEKPLAKTGGSAGFADVWHKDRFAWEYKTKGKYPDLRAAYAQLQLYKEDLDNPPVLVACDIATYEVHVVFTGYQTRVYTFTNADLENASSREVLYYAFTDPERLRPVERAETVTEKAAQRFAEVARLLEKRGIAPQEIAPLFMKVLFALFAEDIRMLPGELMSKAIQGTVLKPVEFPKLARALFRAMRLGEYFGTDRVPHFDGWLYNDDAVLALTADELQYLGEAAKLDWKDIEPSIFGTLFERSIDPRKRSQLGLHYTSKADGRAPAGMSAELAALFPDSFEDSPLGKVPRGWGVVRLDQVCEFAYGKALKADDRQPGDVAVYGSNGQVGWHNTSLVVGPGIIVGRKGNPGIVVWSQNDFFPIDTTFYVVPKADIPLSFLFFALTEINLPALGADSAVPGLNRNLAYMSDFLQPPHPIMAAFAQLHLTLTQRQSANEEQTRTLAALRDALLPRLLSGAVAVGAEGVV